MKTAKEILADSLNQDFADMAGCRYQRYASPAVYVIGDDYYSAHPTKPKHEVGQEWVEHTDQWGARGTNMIVWKSIAG